MHNIINIDDLELILKSKKICDLVVNMWNVLEMNGLTLSY